MLTKPVTMQALAGSLDGELQGPDQVVISDVVHDSRASSPGSLFVAIPGFQTDGHNYTKEAVATGASGLLVEKFVSAPVSQIKVADTRRALAAAAALVHGHPSRQMDVIGITGTNGKTTVTFMLESIAQAAGVTYGRVGTLGTTHPGQSEPQARTTPEASDLQRLLAKMAGDGVRMVGMEVTSHALALHRVEEICWAVAGFTNLSQDHLDFHQDMESYFQTKSQLFDGRARVNVIWTQDPAGERLAGSAPGPVITVGWSDRHDVSAHRLQVGRACSQFVLRIGDEQLAVSVRPGGRHNVANALLAAACAHQVGVGCEDIAAGLEAQPPIPGRLEPVDAGQPFTVLVDYAHTPAAIEQVVESVREGGEHGQLIVVVGGAGDRDPAKRPLMGQAAGAADVAVITSDNPRSEDPELLVKQVAEGARQGKAEVVCQVDRALAIQAALDRAQAGDVVLILGKGHETGQDLGGEIIPFDDRAWATQYLVSGRRP